MSGLPNPQSDDSLQLTTLGAAALYASGKPGPVLQSGKGFCVVVLLALTPGRRISRDLLIDMLWSDVHPDRARNALRQAVWALRRTLGDGALTGASELALTRPLTADRDVFMAHVEANHLDAALAAYGGPFLTALAVPGGAAFEQWADLERRRLETTYLHAAERRVTQLIELGRAREALAVARKVRERAPDAQGARRLVLDAAVAGQDLVTASVEAESLVAWASQMDHELEPSTRRALAAARHMLPAPSTDTSADNRPSVLITDLIGREAAFAQIVRYWDAVREGRAATVSIVGRPGMGKSRLLGDVSTRLKQRGALIIAVGGSPVDRELPFVCAGDLAAALAACRGASGIAPASASTLVALNPALSARFSAHADEGQAADSLTRRVLALADLLQAVSEEQPVVLCIDDLHWVDASSRRVLDGVLTRLRQSRVLACVAGRPTNETPIAADTTIDLSPLSPAQVRDLIHSIGVLPAAAWVGAFVEGVVRSSGGSPLLVLEALRLSLDRQVVHLDEGTWACVDERPLLALLSGAETLRERLRPLAPMALDALAVHSVHGAELSTDQLLAALVSCGCLIDRAQLDALSHDLERQGLVISSVHGSRIAHDEIARVVLEEVRPARRAQLAGCLASVLLAAAPPESLAGRRAARHLIEAGDTVALHRAFRAVVQRHRWHGDRRPLLEMAKEWVGTTADDMLPARLVAKIPVSWRLGLWNGQRQLMAMLLLVALSTIGWSSWRTSEIRRKSAPRLVFLDSARQRWSVTVTETMWAEGASEIALVSEGPADLGKELAVDFLAPVFSPDGRSVAWNVRSGDSTTIDIWLRTPAGTRRLTRRVRDEVAVEWLADGSGLLALTNEWSQPNVGGYDVAVIDTATGNGRQLTSGPDHEGPPRMSPDGMRVAYRRERVGGGGELCVLSRFAGPETIPDCWAVQDAGSVDVVGWISPSEVVVILKLGTSLPLVRVDVDRRIVTLFRDGFTTDAQLSPDRKWLHARMAIDNLPGVHDWLIPIADPRRARQVRVPFRATRPAWWEGAVDTAYVARRLVFRGPAPAVIPGVRSELRVVALTHDGREVPLTVPVRWTNSDSTIAVIDSAGGVRGLRPGVVTVTAQLHHASPTRGRGASPAPFVATRDIRIDAVPVVSLSEEEWRSDWRMRWMDFGEPAPIVRDLGMGERVLETRGDGRYHSYVLQRRAAHALGGLGADVRLSTPITRATFQFARIAFTTLRDTVIDESRPRGAPTADLEDPEAACSATYPAPGLRDATRKLSVRSGVDAWVHLGALGDTLSGGDWWTLRLQILPDGRCGVAVNGRVVWVSPEAVDVSRPRRLRLGDESLGTNIRIGPVRAWQGVVPDVDWTRWTAPSTGLRGTK